ncbi:MAG: DNA protecting protein DprA [Gallionellales bacterium 35-53-114]|jgi:DNA processing protein|nr:MAG: DNA protecting protein DprA [Gallionellales bacterium 35-53-114]OYZ63564.1 MAG: DNA protecting protein DprA [Gallionellales bacterium 24-53-125]OZB10826.1 MAG: DNA protecting protein DprA [Gallionellales bacterium 39-52-133]HQS59000.1 DNA-processing protein DprA [Gallionellaceae bacterium]HQS75615.1 DNA-processing protein DprA [Gallionellaceae bacterium]
MILDAELASWLKLSQVSGLGNESMRSLLHAFGSPSAILATSAATLKQIVRPVVANSIVNAANDDLLAAVSSWLEDPQNHIVTLADADYPQALLNIPDPPFLIYVKGRLDLLNHSSLAVVGSRNASTQGIRNAEAFARAASEADLCIISGMAHGIDTAAHIGGLGGKGSSIAVVGTGLDKVYPSANRDLAHKLAQSGALISEFPLGMPPLAHNFPRRNRIISGLSLGCLVIEATLQSGSLITARMALEQGRDVFAIPGSIHMPLAKGCHALIKQGAKLVENVHDIFEELGWYSSTANTVSSNEAEHPVFAHLGYEPLDIDSLCQRSGLTIEALSAILLQLELDGQVATLAGGMYQRIV